MQKVSAGSWVTNPIAGQRNRLIKLPAETDGRSYEIEYFNQPFMGKKGQPLHFHLIYTERFEILAGKARYQLGTEEFTVETGALVFLPPRIPHLHPWSDSSEELHVRHSVKSDPPDLAGLNACINTGITFSGLSRDGKVGKNGMPGLLQLCVSARSAFPYTYSAGISIVSQRILISMIAIVGDLFGVHATYPAYGEV